MSSSNARCRYSALLALWRLSLMLSCVLVPVAPANSTDMFWGVGRGDGCGMFSSATNWSPGVPWPNDNAHFGMTTSNFDPKAYTVTFTSGATNQQLIVEDDGVTFDLC